MATSLWHHVATDHTGLGKTCYQANTENSCITQTSVIFKVSNITLRTWINAWWGWEGYTSLCQLRSCGFVSLHLSTALSHHLSSRYVDTAALPLTGSSKKFSPATLERNRSRKMLADIKAISFKTRSSLRRRWETREQQRINLHTHPKKKCYGWMLKKHFHVVFLFFF